MRAIHMVSGIQNEASGPSYSVTRLCEGLNAIDCPTQLAVLDMEPGVAIPEFAKKFPMSVGPRFLGRSEQMKNWLCEALSADFDLIHSHGLWMATNLYTGRAARLAQKPLVLSPRGTLAPWALAKSKWRKRAFLLAGQERCLREAACLHATSEQEYRDIRAFGLTAPVTIIPNGVHLPNLSALSVPSNRRQLLFLGRLHRVKAIDRLLDAWDRVAPKFPDWDLEVIGKPEDAYSQEIISRCSRTERAFFRGPLYGGEKTRAYAAAELYILPSHTENFGMTVAEALAAGTAVIASHGTPWKGLVEKDAGYWVDNSVSSLESALEQALSESRDSLTRKGSNGRNWVSDEFSWSEIARVMRQTYDWLLGSGDRPPQIRLQDDD